MTTSDQLHEIPELVQDARLQASFHQDGQRVCTTHQVTAAHRDVWVQKRQLSHREYGFVNLQQKEGPGPATGPQFRAVQSLRTTMQLDQDTLAHPWRAFTRELETLVKFSGEKVSVNLPQ